ncbi:MAG TPA: sugar transferase [Bacteroidia bacterium]|jgi:lipopolysaccharide/colanic/teichoic acid biosynthesis glycosyltransferase|nr:sugar transferase [Bacteroidia bacterium]
MVKRLFDILFSVIGIVILSPFLIITSFIIMLTSKGGAFYRQTRIGKDSKPFRLFKFRTMRIGSDKQIRITIGNRDSRITGVGYFLRKYKLDELPQLFNVLIGDMSFVGPRPEVPEYVALYNAEQQIVLSVKPGITDFASIVYSGENELLANAENPEELYIKRIMPAKLKLNMRYINEMSLTTDIKIILKTIGKIFRQ